MGGQNLVKRRDQYIEITHGDLDIEIETKNIDSFVTVDMTLMITS